MPAPTNPFKKALHEGKQQIGCWAGFADPYATEVLATANFDWLVIDGEHAPNDIRSLMAQLAILDGKHSHPVVRLPVGNDWLIKQALDIGAQTLLIPMVETAEQARDLVRASLYPPHGIRGSGAALARASRFSDIPDYVKTANDQIMVIPQVETVKGMQNLEEILKVDGIDAVFIGPSDLAADMGYLGDTTQQQVQDTIKAAIMVIAAAGKSPGILAVEDAAARRYAEWGAKFIAVGIDVVMLAKTARATMQGWT